MSIIYCRSLLINTSVVNNSSLILKSFLYFGNLVKIQFHKPCWKNDLVTSLTTSKKYAWIYLSRIPFCVTIDWFNRPGSLFISLFLISIILFGSSIWSNKFWIVSLGNLSKDSTLSRFTSCSISIAFKLFLNHILIDDRKPNNDASVWPSSNVNGEPCTR